MVGYRLKKIKFFRHFIFQDEIDDSDEYETVEESDSGEDFDYDNEISNES